MFFNCNWCRTYCCRREQHCNKSCHKDRDDCEKEYKCCPQKKWCCIEQPDIYDNKNTCRCNNSHYQEKEGFYNGFNQTDNCDDDFKYYYQYGSFNNLNQTENKCNCGKKEQDHTKDCENYYKPNKEQYCKPTKFICFPIDK